MSKRTGRRTGRRFKETVPCGEQALTLTEQTAFECTFCCLQTALLERMKFADKVAMSVSASHRVNKDNTTYLKGLSRVLNEITYVSPSLPWLPYIGAE